MSSMNPASLQDSTIAPTTEPAAGGPDSESRRGKVMVAVGWALTVVGIVLYCVVNLRATPSAEAGSELSGAVNQATRAAVIVMAAGVLCWLVGAFSYLRALIDEDARTPGSPGSPRAR